MLQAYFWHSLRMGIAIFKMFTRSAQKPSSSRRMALTLGPTSCERESGSSSSLRPVHGHTGVRRVRGTCAGGAGGLRGAEEGCGGGFEGVVYWRIFGRCTRPSPPPVAGRPCIVRGAASRGTCRRTGSAWRGTARTRRCGSARSSRATSCAATSCAPRRDQAPWWCFRSPASRQAKGGE